MGAIKPLSSRCSFSISAATCAVDNILASGPLLAARIADALERERFQVIYII